MTTCDVVAERVALGEPLGDAGEHAERCPKCRRLVALPAELGATRTAAQLDPGLGFSARMTAGAQQRVVVRRRKRIAAGMAAVVAAAAVAAVIVTRTPHAPKLATNPPDPTQQPATGTHDENKNDPWKDKSDVDDDVRALVQLADTDGARHATARWKRIQQPLAPYRALLQGVEP